MTDLQNKYDMLLEDIKFLLQYDDKYMKIDKNNIVKPNKLNELEKQIGNIKQKQSGIKLQIKNNNDNKELITNEIRIINKKQNNIETEITELNNNTKIIQEEQQSKLNLINTKCKELDELCNLFTGNKCTIYVIQNINKKILSHINNINFDNNIIKQLILHINSIYILLCHEYSWCKIENTNITFLNNLEKPINNKQLLCKFNIDEKYITSYVDCNLNIINDYIYDDHYLFAQQNMGCICNDVCITIATNEYKNKIKRNYKSWIFLTPIFEEFTIIKTMIDKTKNEIMIINDYEINNINEKDLNYKKEYENLSKSINELYEMKNNIVEQITQNKLLIKSIDTIEQHIRLNKIQLDLTEQINIYSIQIENLNKLNEDNKMINKQTIENKKIQIYDLLKKLKLQCIYLLFRYIYQIQDIYEMNNIIKLEMNFFPRNHIKLENKYAYISKKLLEYIDIDYYNKYVKNYSDDELLLLYDLKMYFCAGFVCQGSSREREEYDGVQGNALCLPKNYNKNFNYITLFNNLYEKTLQINKKISIKELNNIFEIICEDEINNLDLNIFDIYYNKINQTMTIINNIKEQYYIIFKKCKYIYDTIYNTNIISDYILKSMEIKEQISKINIKVLDLNNIFSKNEELIKQKNNDIEKIEMQNKLLDLEFDEYNIEISKLEIEFTTLEKVYNLRLHYSL
jgi:hypothetical protein